MNHLLTINVGDYMHPNVRASLQDAASRWDARYIEVTEAFGLAGPKDPYGMKAEWFRWPDLADDDKVLLLDSDLLIRGDCPNLFDLTLSNRVGVVRNFQGDHTADEVEMVGRQYRSVCGTASLDTDTYANIGVCVIPVGLGKVVWGEMWETLTGIRPLNIADQHVVSALLTSKNRDILPDEFNRTGPRAWHDGPEMRSYVEHYADIGGRRPRPKDYYLAAREWQKVPVGV